MKQKFVYELEVYLVVRVNSFLQSVWRNNSKFEKKVKIKKLRVQISFSTLELFARYLLRFFYLFVIFLLFARKCENTKE